MKINTSSWHYKLVTKWVNPNRWPATSLCKYFWQVAFRVIAVALFSAGMGVFSFAIGGGIVASIFATTATAWWLYPLGTVLGAATIALVVGLCFAIAYGICKALELRNDRLHERQRKIRSGEIILKEPSLVTQFLKAKKSKICPMLEFVQPEGKK